MTVAFGKLFELKSSNHRDTEPWKAAEFNELCSKCSNQCGQTSHFYKAGGKLFNSNAGRQAYRKFCKLNISPDTKLTANMTILINASEANAADSFKEHMMHRSIASPTLLTLCLCLSSVSDLPTDNGGEPREEVSLPKESVRRLQNLLPAGSSNLLQSWFYTFHHGLENHIHFLNLELFFPSSRSDTERLNNNKI